MFYIEENIFMVFTSGFSLFVTLGALVFLMLGMFTLGCYVCSGSGVSGLKMAQRWRHGLAE